MKAHTPVMYADSEQSWNGGRVGKIITPSGGGGLFLKKIVHNVCISFNLSRRKSVVVYKRFEH